MTRLRFVVCYLTGISINFTECRFREPHSQAEHRDPSGSRSEQEPVGKPFGERNELWFPGSDEACSVSWSPSGFHKPAGRWCRGRDVSELPESLSRWCKELAW